MVLSPSQDTVDLDAGMAPPKSAEFEMNDMFPVNETVEWFAKIAPPYNALPLLKVRSERCKLEPPST